MSGASEHVVGEVQKWVSYKERKTGNQKVHQWGFHPTEQLCNRKAKHLPIKMVAN